MFLPIQHFNSLFIPSQTKLICLVQLLAGPIYPLIGQILAPIQSLTKIIEFTADQVSNTFKRIPSRLNGAISFLSNQQKNKWSSKIFYSLRLILLVANMDVSKTKMYLDTSILVKTNMDQREYQDGRLQTIPHSKA
jgi:hypothetical protein